MTEREKYETLYDQVPEYRKGSPDVGHLKRFRHYIHPTDTINLYGAGPGRAGRILAEWGREVMMIDIAANCLEEGVKAYMKTNPRLRFVHGDIADAASPMDRADWGLCCDVMEHIPTELVDRVLINIRYLTSKCYFAISTVKDGYGKHIGETLHMTVKPYEWWDAKLARWWPERALREESGSMIVIVCGKGA